MPAVTKTVLLVADNTAVTLDVETLLLIGSDNTTATNRTFTLPPSTVGAGHRLTLVWNTAASSKGELVDTGTMKLNGNWLPSAVGDTLSLLADGTNWVETGRAYTTAASNITLTDTHILVGNSSNVAVDVAMSGDVTIDDLGATTIAALAVTNAKVSASAAIAYSKLATLTNTHILVGSAGGVATDVALSGDATLANTGALTIGAGAVGYSKLQLAGSLLVADFSAPVMQETATITLSQANIQAMNATPVSLITAPGAGKLIIVDEIECLHTYSTAAYASGGDVSIQYSTSAAPVQVFDVVAVTETNSRTFLWKPTAGYASSATASTQTDLATSINKGIEVTNAVGAFTNGNAANIFKLRVRYHVVTALT